MANIRIVGFLNEGGSVTEKTGSTSDTLIANTHIAPQSDENLNFGTSLLKWGHAYFDEIHTKLRHVNTAKYTENSAVQRYVRWDAAGSNAEAGVNNKFIAPVDGSLLSLSIRATNASNSTTINFHKGSNGSENVSATPVETKTINMSSANTTYKVTFSSSTFNAGDILGISLTPTIGFGNVNITCVWLFDWNA